VLNAIDHVNLVVLDLPKMIDFYTGVLGLRLTKRGVISGPWIDAVVGLAGVEAEFTYLDSPVPGPRVELIQYKHPAAPRPDGLGQSNTPGLRHLAFVVSDIESLVASLGRCGVRFFSAVQSVPASQVQYAAEVRKFLVYFHDPEGNLLELCEYRTGDAKGDSARPG
jgi:catechol 2,3-dioxygenase-like lactoylglutathione lyase family enzyme